MSMPIRSLAFAVAVAVAAACLVQAAPFDPAARAKAIAPFLDEQTVAVMHVDLTRLDVESILAKLVEIVPALGQEIQSEGVEVELRQAREGFLKAGAKELYLVASLADLPPCGPIVIIPHAAEVDPALLRASMPSAWKADVMEPVGGAMFFGAQAAFDRFKATEPDPRPDLAKAFEAAGDTAAQFVVLPPSYAARVIRETMPTLPAEIGGGPSAVLTEGLLWAVLGVDVAPKMALRLTIQSRDELAAAALRAKWLDAVRFLCAQEAARKAVPDLEEVAASTIPNVEGDRLVLRLSEPEDGIRALSAAITPPLQEARARAQRMQSMNDLKHLGLAMHNYHDLKKSFPAVGNTDAGGKLLLSWRVHILPFVEQQKLYDQFHLDEPWDSEHNRTLIDKMPEAYRCPASKHRKEQGLSTYRVVTGEGTVFPGREGVPLKEIKDGTSNTIMIVEVDDDHAVIWTKPEGLPFDPDHPARGLGGHFEGGFHVAMCDGSVRFVVNAIAPETLRALFTRAGREPIAAW
ncbi:MAG TPA: DUF1559 domain-containing protein [Thermoguttaceae bacterium]|nr:DUF1559 domain-containing protein [Thermoguttaceae bacterium]